MRRKLNVGSSFLRQRPRISRSKNAKTSCGWTPSTLSQPASLIECGTSRNLTDPACSMVARVTFGATVEHYRETS